MEGGTLPEYLSQSEPKRNRSQDINDFTFSEHDNPQKNTQLTPETQTKEQKSSSIEPATHQQPEKQPEQQQKEEEGQKEKENKVGSKEIQQYLDGSNNKEQTQRLHGSEDEEVESRGYQDLTLKLETALNKISGAKKGVKPSNQSNTIWRRAQQCAQRKKKDLQKKREESDSLKHKEIQPKPIINKHSQKIIRQVGHEPIYNRVDKMVETKKKREKQIEEAKKKQKEEEEETFMEQLNRHMRKPEHMRSYTEYFEEMVKWKERAAKVNREKLEEKKSKQLQGVTFKPNLNPKSKKMVTSHNRLPIDQRGLMKDKPKNEYTFKPNVSRRAGK